MSDFRVSDPDFARRVQASFDRQRFMAWLGARLELIEPGRCTVRLPVKEALGQQHGYVHAGVTTAIADSAAGYAAYTLFPADSSVLTIELKINLLAPAQGQALLARAHVVRHGRTITVVQSDVFGLREGTEKHVATMQATMMCLHHAPEIRA